MEIDIREVPDGDRLDRVLQAIENLGKTEVLTVFAEEDPAPLASAVKRIHGDSVDLMKARWGSKELAWVMHAKKSRMQSAYEPQE